MTWDEALAHIEKFSHLESDEEFNAPTPAAIDAARRLIAERRKFDCEPSWVCCTAQAGVALKWYLLGYKAIVECREDGSYWRCIWSEENDFKNLDARDGVPGVGSPPPVAQREEAAP